MRRSKYSTEDDLAPRSEMLHGRARLGVKYAETLGYGFVALGEGSTVSLGRRLSFMPDGLYSPKGVGGEFCELRLDGVLGTSRVRGSHSEFQCA